MLRYHVAILGLRAAILGLIELFPNSPVLMSEDSCIDYKILHTGMFIYVLVCAVRSDHARPNLRLSVHVWMGQSTNECVRLQIATLMRWQYRCRLKKLQRSIWKRFTPQKSTLLSVLSARSKQENACSRAIVWPIGDEEILFESELTWNSVAENIFHRDKIGNIMKK